MKNIKPLTIFYNTDTQEIDYNADGVDPMTARGMIETIRDLMRPSMVIPMSESAIEEMEEGEED